MFFETLYTYEWPSLVLLCIFALCIGSFINVVAYRLPVMLQRQWASETQHPSGSSPAATPRHAATFNLAQPRSHCPNCGEQLKVVDNLPVVSWLWLRGQCRFCRSVISYRYPLVELGALALGLAIVAVHGYSVPSLFYCGLA